MWKRKFEADFLRLSDVQSLSRAHQIETKAFNPEPDNGLEPIFLEPAEIEVMRLIDLENLNQ